MRTRFLLTWLSALLAAALAAGCATRFQQPDVAAPHAVVAFPSQEDQRSSGMFLEPMTFNGVLRPQNWLVDSFRVPPGKVELLLRAAQENLQGTCMLGFAAVEGETYAVGAQFLDETFTMRASRDGRTVAECVSPATILPTPQRIPGVPVR